MLVEKSQKEAKESTLTQVKHLRRPKLGVREVVVDLDAVLLGLFDDVFVDGGGGRCLFDARFRWFDDACRSHLPGPVSTHLVRRDGDYR